MAYVPIKRTSFSTPHAPAITLGATTPRTYQEYKRLVGTPPMRDVEQLRGLLRQAPASEPNVGSRRGVKRVPITPQGVEKWLQRPGVSTTSRPRVPAVRARVLAVARARGRGAMDRVLRSEEPCVGPRLARPRPGPGMPPRRGRRVEEVGACVPQEQDVALTVRFRSADRGDRLVTNLGHGQGRDGRSRNDHCWT